MREIDEQGTVTLAMPMKWSAQHNLIAEPAGQIGHMPGSLGHTFLRRNCLAIVAAIFE